MKKRILKYRRSIDAILAQGGDRDWESLLQEHLLQISFFQHERLVHLIVTALFALLEIVAVALVLLAFSPAVLALCAVVPALLIPYIGHYFLLENEVHKLYDQYDRLRENCKESLRLKSFCRQACPEK